MKVKNESEKAVLKLNIEKMNHGIQSHHFMANRWGNNGNSDRLYILGLQKSLQMVTAALKLKDACSSKKSYDQPRQHIKKQKHYFANKGPSSQGYGFSSSHEWMWELDYKESWALKNWCFWTVVLEKTLESPLDSKEIKPVSPKGNQSWIFIGYLFTHSCWMNATYWIIIHLFMLKLTLQYYGHRCEELTHWKRPWCWERLKAEEEGDDRGWDGWMASLTRWT